MMTVDFIYDTDSSFDEEDQLLYDESYEKLTAFEQEENSTSSTGLERLASRLNLADDYKSSLNIQRTRTKDRADRAVTEQVLDPRIRMILLKMINRGVFFEVNGCLSTGKEANVYHAVTDDGQHRAIKIYKSTILTFKNRDRYVTGEYRFRNGYSRSNPRKMTQTWAEKEMRNLKRLEAAGIPCPEAILLKLQVLVMRFIGDDKGWPAPRLKDFPNLDKELHDDPQGSTTVKERLYRQCCSYMRRLYQDCHLVHADLSEYNMLVHHDSLVIIDVSQSVEHDHPHALDFLRIDCQNVLRFFSSSGGLKTVSLKQLFDFIVTPDLTEADALKAFMMLEPEGYTEDAIFRDSFMPQVLDDVVDVEREIVKGTDVNALIVGVKTGTNNNNNNNNNVTLDANSSTESDGSSESDTDSHDDSDSETEMTPEQLKQARKENKKQVKAENREKRKQKMKKHEKRRAEKTTKTKKH